MVPVVEADADEPVIGPRQLEREIHRDLPGPHLVIFAVMRQQVVKADAKMLGDGPLDFSNQNSVHRFSLRWVMVSALRRLRLT